MENTPPINENSNSASSNTTGAEQSPEPGWDLNDADSFAKSILRYSNYLRLLAEVQLGQYMRSRLGASDVVQETFLEATRDWQSFRGKSDMELLAWLKKILFHNVNQAIDFHMAKKRSIRKEVSMERMVAMHFSSLAIENALAANVSSPSEPARKREMMVAVADCMAMLSDEHRQILILRTLQSKTYQEIAPILGKSVEACRMSWVRAVKELRQHFVAKDLI